MQPVPKGAISARSPNSVWRTLILLFAGVLMLGFFQPLMASAHSSGLKVQDKTVVETNTTSTAFVRVLLTHRLDHKVSVRYATFDGTAKAGSDYSATSGKVVFPAGLRVQRIPVSILGDTTNEQTEYFGVRLFHPRGAPIFDGTGIVRILDNDSAPAPLLSVGDVSVTEGGLASFVVSLSSPASQPVTFDYATSNGSAFAPGDYTAASGSKIIGVGSSSTTIGVQTYDDKIVEGNETFTLTVSNVSGAGVADGQATATILDNDVALPTLAVHDTKVFEGHAALFTVELSKASSVPVTVLWATHDGSATAPADYVRSFGKVYIPAGQLHGHFWVKTVDDSIDEVNEVFFVHLFKAENATISDGNAAALIIDNDGPKVSIGDTHATEGQDLVFNVTLSEKSVQDVYVKYRTADHAALKGLDYTAASGVVKIPAGHLMEQIHVKTIDDALDEIDEIMFVDLYDPFNATIGDGHAEGLIVDNDPAPMVYIQGTADVVEGNHAVLTVTLGAKSGKTVKVDFATADDSATALHDYTAIHGTLTFAPGETSKTIAVETLQDHTTEVAEYFYVNLSNPDNALASPHMQGIVKILANTT